jgi:hypothetical protein
MKVSRSSCSASDPCAGLTDVSGCLSSSQLKSVGIGSNRLLTEAADAFIKMYADMPPDIKKAVVLTDSYRPLKIQCNIFDWDWFEKTGKKRKKGTAGTAAASPGGSNHGWGRAIDISPASVQKWIVDNGEKYGWTWNEGKAVKEPWHFTYCGPGPNKNEKWCSGVTDKITIDVKSSSSTPTTTTTSGTTTNASTQSPTSNKAEGGTFGMLGGGKLMGFLDAIFPSKKKEEKKDEEKKDEEKTQVTEEVDRIHEIMKKIL